MNKKYSMDDLSRAVKDRDFHKSKYQELVNEQKVLEGKLNHINNELNRLESNIHKHEKILLDIIGELNYESFKRGSA